jgi:hypothetical protein
MSEETEEGALIRRLIWNNTSNVLFDEQLLLIRFACQRMQAVIHAEFALRVGRDRDEQMNALLRDTNRRAIEAVNAELGRGLL